MVDAVIFDLDETLLDRTGSLRAFLADQYDRHRDCLGDVRFEDWRNRFLVLDERGHVAKALVYAALLSEFDGVETAVGSLLADYQARCADFARPFDGMADTLAVLRSNDLAIGIVTNGGTIFQTRHIEALGLHRMVDAILISETEGLRKPDPALFRRAARRLGARPEDCLFVGDNPVADVLGAAAAGMKTAWFRSGGTWHAHGPPVPGATIDRLDEVLSLVDETAEPLSSRRRDRR